MKKLGLALGGGSARGLAHIGILKELHRHKIYPDYLAGTSIGAVIAAMYAAGHSPEEIEQIAKTTNWKGIVDFTIPKSGLIKGELIENDIRKLVLNKHFKELRIPTKIVAYNLSTHEEVIFSQGDVAKAVRASISIPGIFTPLKIGGDMYVDGALANPTPFDVVKQMGAEVVIAVDLFQKEKVTQSITAPKSTLLQELKKKLIADELLNTENYLFPAHWPEQLRRILRWGFEKILYPKRVLRILAGKELPTITKIMYASIGSLINNLAQERIKNAKIDIVIKPKFKHLHWSDFDKVEELVKIGENAIRQEMPGLRRKLRH